MRYQFLFLLCVLSLAVLSGACGESTKTTNVNIKTNAANSSINANANNPLGTTKTPEAATTNNAPTITPIVEGYYAALQKKDEAGVKKYLSPSAIKYNEAAMKEEKKYSMLAYLEDAESPVAAKREVRNEKIEGDTATAEIKGGSLAVWTPVKFVKENGEWKFASAEDTMGLQDIGKSAANSNTAK